MTPPIAEVKLIKRINKRKKRGELPVLRLATKAVQFFLFPIRVADYDDLGLHKNERQLFT